MPLNTPDKIDETGEQQPEQSGGDSEPVVVLDDEALPVSEAVRFVYEQLYSEVNLLRQERSDLQERVDTLENVVENQGEVIRELRRIVEVFGAGFEESEFYELWQEYGEHGDADYPWEWETELEESEFEVTVRAE